MPPTGVWPGLDDTLAQAFEMVGAGQNINVLPNVRARRATYWHRVMVNATATNQTNIPLFSNATNTVLGTTNLPQPGFLPTQQPMWLTGVSIEPQPGSITIAGNGNGAGGQMVDAAATDPIANAEEIRALFQTGSFQLKVGDYIVVDNYGLGQFPAAGGIFTGAAEFTGGFGFMALNGFPTADNMYKCTPWYPILPQKQIVGQLTWNAANTVTTTFAIKVTLHGIQVTPSNL